MKPMAWACATVVLATCVTAALGQGGPPAGEGAGRGNRGGGGAGQRGGGNFGGRGGMAANPGGALIQQYANQYETMLQRVNLSEEQKPKVKAKVDAMVTDLRAYGDSVAQGGTGRRGAGTGAGTSAGAQTGQAARERDEMQQIADEHQVKINAELTLDQRYVWELYKINRALVPRLQPLALSEEQNGRIKAATDETVKGLIALNDGKEIPALHGRLYRKVVAEVLTEEQAGRLLETSQPAVGGMGRGMRNNAAGENNEGGAEAGGRQGQGRGFGQGGGGQGAGRGGPGGGRGARGGGRGGLP